MKLKQNGILRVLVEHRGEIEALKARLLVAEARLAGAIVPTRPGIKHAVYGGWVIGGKPVEPAPQGNTEEEEEPSNPAPGPRVIYDGVMTYRSGRYSDGNAAFCMPNHGCAWPYLPIRVTVTEKPEASE